MPQVGIYGIYYYVDAQGVNVRYSHVVWMIEGQKLGTNCCYLISYVTITLLYSEISTFKYMNVGNSQICDIWSEAGCIIHA